MNKEIKIKITLFDESEIIWTAPTKDPKMAAQILKGTRWLENANEFFNTDYILKWEIMEG